MEELFLKEKRMHVGSLVKVLVGKVGGWRIAAFGVIIDVKLGMDSPNNMWGLYSIFYAGEIWTNQFEKVDFKFFTDNDEDDKDDE
jgi:hypothetical protein